MSGSAQRDLPGDGDLLAAFAENGQQAAFEDIVRRHGGMVLGVCRSVLGLTADAEDAAQAVFLTLARRAGSLTRRASVAGWLHDVAWYVATRAAQARAVRRRHEAEAARMKPVVEEPREEPIVAEVVHAALAELPEKYRVPILLCHIEGRSQEEAAVLLGCKKAALSMRLIRGREMLRARLTRRGMAVSATGVALALGAQAAPAAPAKFVAMAGDTAVAALCGTVASAASISGQTLALSKGAINMLFWAKMKSAAMIMMAVLLAGGGAAGTYTAIAGQAKGEGKTAARDAATQEQGIAATVVSVDAERLAITVKTGNKTEGVVEQTWSLAPGVRVILLAGKGQQAEGKLPDVSAGDPVILRTAADEKTVVAIVVQGRSGNYIIRSVDPEKRAIVVVAGKGKEASGEQEFDVADDAVITIAAGDGKGKGKAPGEAKGQGEPRRLSDLVAGTPVGLQFAPGNARRVTAITIQPRTIVGLARAVDVQKNAITVASGERDETFTLAGDARILLEDEQGPREAQLADLAGLRVTVRLSALQPGLVTDIRVVNKGKNPGKADN